MGKKILVPCFDVYNDRPFPEKYTVKDHISNTKLEKGDHYYIQTRHNMVNMAAVSVKRSILGALNEVSRVSLVSGNKGLK